jgi:hypothetical protein
LHNPSDLGDTIRRMFVSDDQKKLKTYGVGWEQGYYVNLSINPDELAKLPRVDKFGNVRATLCRYKVPNEERGSATHYIKLDEYYYNKKGIPLDGDSYGRSQQPESEQEDPEF